MPAPNRQKKPQIDFNLTSGPGIGIKPSFRNLFVKPNTEVAVLENCVVVVAVVVVAAAVVVCVVDEVVIGCSRRRSCCCCCCSCMCC